MLSDLVYDKFSIDLLFTVFNFVELMLQGYPFYIAAEEVYVQNIIN